MKVAIQERKQIQFRRRMDGSLMLLFLVCTSIGIIALMILLGTVLMDGLKNMKPELFTSYPTPYAEDSGLKSALVGTFYLLIMMTPIAFVLGVGAAIYLEEYAKKNRLNQLLQICISTLAGIPSIVYGILGLTLFVDVLAFGRSLISGVLTMTLLVLPIIIVAAQEAIKSVPNARRDASFALGATKWQTVQGAVLPSAIPGILTGVILAMSRAIGETAPLLMVGAVTYIAFLPEKLTDSFAALPIQIYSWVSKPQPEFQDLAASGIIVLLVLLLVLNITAVIIRNHYSKRI